MGPMLVLLLALVAAPPTAPAPAPTPVAVRAEGASMVRSARAPIVDRYVLDVTEKGTVLILVTPIHGRTPKVVLKNDEQLIVRRADKHGQIWARPPAGTRLFVEVTQPKDAEGPTTYLLKVAFDIDRPRELRDQPRASRPGEIVRLKVGSAGDLDRVMVDGIAADYKIVAPDVLVTIPAFARSGRVELLFQSGATKQMEIELIGAERDGVFQREECALGCVQVVLDPRVSGKWLQAIASLVDADIAHHDREKSIAHLRLRLARNERFALETLASVKGVVSARATALGPAIAD